MLEAEVVELGAGKGAMAAEAAELRRAAEHAEAAAAAAAHDHAAVRPLRSSFLPRLSAFHTLAS